VAFFIGLIYASSEGPAIASPTTAPEISPSPQATPATQIDPFCSVGFLTSPWDVRLNEHSKIVNDRLMARLYLDASNLSARTIGAHLILLSDTQAFEADVPDFSLETSSRRRTARFLIALPSAMSIKYVYVDGYDTDGGGFIDCPTEMSGNATVQYRDEEFPARASAAGAAIPVVTAKFRQALPPLPCGKISIAARVKRVVQPNWAYGISKRISSQIEVYLDSHGTVVKTEVYKSSGFEAADEQVRMAAFNSTYVPAQFLCQPVVSEYLFTGDFEP
jgi:hypothetical protein